MAEPLSALAARGRASENAMNRPALMYHDIVAAGDSDASGFPGTAAAHYKLDIDEFSRHLAALAGSGLRFGSVTGTPRSGGGMLTFDDGGASAVRTAALLSEHGMIGHFLITTAQIGQPGFVTATDLRALRAEGHLVGSHSHTHPTDISRLAASLLNEEWRRSVDCLRQLLGEPVEVASVPGGFYAQHVVQAAAAAGIRYLFTSEPTLRVHYVDECLVLGRYTLWRDMPATLALSLALGTRATRQRQWLAWNLKKPLKRWARPVYEMLRRYWLDGA
jgi:peptidoglycan/xylan/chitin deacetylase (PgdA/CDA1 family)